MIWLTGGALAVAVMMIVGLLLLVVYQGMSTFWPLPVERVVLYDGTVYLGEVAGAKLSASASAELAGLPDDLAEQARDRAAAGGTLQQQNLRIENFELTNEHFVWVDEAGNPGSNLSAMGRRRRAADQRPVLRDSDRLLVGGQSGGRGRGPRLGKVRPVPRRRPAPGGRRGVPGQDPEFQLQLQTADGQNVLLPLENIVRAYPANQLGLLGKLGIYLSRWREFLCDGPREANSEGGVFPAIFGTVVMTLLMSLAVVPFGVLAALYLREYARAGTIVSAVRIAINNLAGVPSIVFGVFGLGFFCYLVGGQIDRWFFPAAGASVFGTPGILWASLTLALLTLPVVIVTTEEALAAVPSSMREGSYACGASKWQTIHRIVLPRAMPGIMTGMILAMARGAGEVAPLMLVGAMKTVPVLPVDGTFPYIHAQRAFMHLGYHIFDLGFHSQNSMAAAPMVFTTTLLLVAIVGALNIVAIWLRARLRRRFVTSHF